MNASIAAIPKDTLDNFLISCPSHTHEGQYLFLGNIYGDKQTNYESSLKTATSKQMQESLPTPLPFSGIVLSIDD